MSKSLGSIPATAKNKVINVTGMHAVIIIFIVHSSACDTPDFKRNICQSMIDRYVYRSARILSCTGKCLPVLKNIYMWPFHITTVFKDGINFSVKLPLFCALISENRILLGSPGQPQT